MKKNFMILVMTFILLLSGCNSKSDNKPTVDDREYLSGLIENNFAPEYTVVEMVMTIEIEGEEMEMKIYFESDEVNKIAYMEYDLFIIQMEMYIDMNAQLMYSRMDDEYFVEEFSDELLAQAEDKAMNADFLNKIKDMDFEKIVNDDGSETFKVLLNEDLMKDAFQEYDQSDAKIIGDAYVYYTFLDGTIINTEMDYAIEIEGSVMKASAKASYPKSLEIEIPQEFLDGEPLN